VVHVQHLFGPDRRQLDKFLGDCFGITALRTVEVLVVPRVNLTAHQVHFVRTRWPYAIYSLSLRNLDTFNDWLEEGDT
jgi:hypothetical protein